MLLKNEHIYSPGSRKIQVQNTQDKTCKIKTTVKVNISDLVCLFLYILDGSIIKTDNMQSCKRHHRDCPAIKTQTDYTIKNVS